MKKSEAAKPSSDSDDDPFDIGGQAGKRAVRVHPKPAKGRMYRVECPMCESPGFVPRSAAGEEVRCWNKECKLPLYKAPAIEKEPEPEPEQKKSFVMPIVLAVVVAAVGGGVYYAMNSGPEEKVIQPIGPVAGNNDPEESGGTGGLVHSVEDKGPTIVTKRDIVSKALEALPGKVIDPANQSQDDSYRLAAESFILAGDTAQADAMLSRIRGSASFYRIRPLVMRATDFLKAGDTDEANKAATEALGYAANLPRAGRESLDWATDLAILLVQLDRSDEAAGLIARNHDEGIRGEYSAMLAGARNSGTYNLADLAGGTLIRNTPNPQWVAVTRGLITAGKRDMALAWAKKGEGDVGADALVAWAGTLAADESVDADAIAAQANSPALAARLLAAAALEILTQANVAEPVAAAEGDDSGAESVVPKAPTQVTTLLDAALAKLPAEPAAAMKVPSLREIYDSRRKPRGGLADPTDVRTEALAYQKVAELQNALGQADAAWATLQSGLEQMRSYAPGPDEMQAVVDGYEKRASSLRSQLESEFNLDSRSKVNRAFIDYRKQVDNFKEAADERFRLQDRLAQTAINIGAETELLAWIDSAEGEPWWSSATASDLTKSSDAAIASAAKAKVTGDLPKAAEPWRRIVFEAVQQGDAIGLAERLKKLKSDQQTQGLWAGVAASLFVKNGDEKRFRDLVDYLDSPTIRSNLVEMGMAQAMTRDGDDGVRMFQLLIDPASRLKPHELVATYRGTVSGSRKLSEEAETPPPAETTGEQ